MEKLALALAGQKSSTNSSSIDDKVTDDITVLVRKKVQKRSTDLTSVDAAKRSKIGVVGSEESQEA